MRVPFSWLKEFVALSGTAERLAHDLTMHGLEVEAIEEIGEGDKVLDISITPNRPDCLSILGIAREVSAIYGIPIVMPWEVPQLAVAQTQQIPVTITSPELCHRYMGACLGGIEIGPSPDWLVQRLRMCGVRPLNNVVDCTNYVLLELGQPLHAFDVAALEGPEILVRIAREKERITTLDGRDRVLDPSMLVIADAARPVAVAGIMGGADSEVTPSSKNILLESAWFTPSQVRKTAKSMKISSEASFRFERGVDPEGIPIALARTASLILGLAGGRLGSVYDANPVPFHKRLVSLRISRACRIMGTDVPRRVIEDILGRIGLEITSSGEERIEGFAPSFRPDIISEIDLIEEIARLYGYERIPSRIPCARLSVQGPGSSSLSAEVKENLRNQGMHEAISYSFLSRQEIAALDFPEDSPKMRFVRLLNPLSDDQGVMRTSIVSSLLKAVALNQRRRTLDIRLFEVGRTFESQGAGKLPREEERVAGVISGARYPASWGWPKEQTDIHDIKGVVEVLLSGLRRGPCIVRDDQAMNEPFYLSGTAARILAGENVELGTLGEMAPKVLERFGISGRVFAFDLSIDIMKGVAARLPRFSPIPRFPSVERDVAILLPDAIRAADVLSRIEAIRPQLLESVAIFDVYRGKPIPKGTKSLAFRLCYRAPDRTLTEEEVSELHAPIVADLLRTFEAAIRQ